MKTKKMIKYLLVVATASLMFTACKKNKDEINTDDVLQQTTSALDQSRVESESNAVMDDANNAIEGVSSTRSMLGLNSINLCNVTIDSSQKLIGLLTLVYNGNDCNNIKSRTGSIRVQLPYDSTTTTVTKWKVLGSKITLTFNNYKVTNLSDNKSLTFNGTHSVTNVSGGVIADLFSNSNPIVHKIRANMILTFDDGTNRTWQAARLRTFTVVGSGTNGIISATLAGDTTINTIPNVAMWGTNRASEDFYISITTPIFYTIYNSSCLYKPLRGVRVHKRLARELTVTYGVDGNGNTTTLGCPYGYKLNWTNAQGVAKQVIKAY